jgi:hypothetical protein
VIDSISTKLNPEIDRATWGPGDWDFEFDNYRWTDPTGLACVIVRRSHGAFCGYVGVPEGHSLYEADYSDIRGDVQNVHGSLTFTGYLEEEAAGSEWWLGFDCNHGFDKAPNPVWSVGGEGEYRTDTYVMAEVQKLANAICTREMNYGGSKRTAAIHEGENHND